MRKVLLSILIISVCFELCAVKEDQKSVSFDTIDEVALTQRFLHKGGLKKFVEYVASTGVKAPKIYSKYWIDRREYEDVEQEKLERSYREFGLEFLRQVDRVALEVFRNPERSQEQGRLELLLQAASWIGAPGKFENYRVALRCEDAATIPLLRIIVDEDIPIEVVKGFVARFTTQKKSAPIRAAILYEESNGVFDVRKLALRADKKSDGFDREWAGYHGRSFNHYGGKIMEYSKNVDRLRQEPDKYAFFTDDNPGWPYADSTHWDCKLHMRICVYRSQATVLNPLIGVLRFRELAGGFAKVKVRPNERERDAYERWYRQHYEWMFHQYGVCADTAAAYYIRCLRNTYYDPQTGDLLSRAEHDECARKNMLKGAVYSGRPLDLESQNVKNKNLVTRK